MKRKISLHQEQEIIKKYLSGIKTKILAKEYDCDISTITNYLKKNNIQARGSCGNLTPQIEIEIMNNLLNFESVLSITKTLKLKYPQNLDNNLFWPFIRGLFDGDGNFYYRKLYNKTNWSIISNISFCQEIQDKLLTFNLNSRIYQNKNKHENIAEIRIHAHKDIKKIFDYMYEDTNNLYLTRKYEKFIKFLKYNCLA